MPSSARSPRAQRSRLLACAFAALSLAFATAVFPDAATSSPDGTWSPVALTAAPGPLEAHAGCYDPVRHRMIVFGGWDGAGPRNSTWTLSLDGSPRWTRLYTAGPLPEARYGHTMVYDPERDRMLVFGGTGSGSASFAYGGVWALSLGAIPTWSRIASPDSGPARVGHCAIYDPLRDRLVVFGGYDGLNFHADTWAFPLAGPAGWTELDAAAPPSARDWASAAYDPAGDRMIVFGGNALDGGAFPAPVNDTWELRLSGAPAWSPLAVTGAPPSPRLGAGATYDAVRRRMLLFGGSDGIDGHADLYALSLAGTPGWTDLTPVAGAGPAIRWCPALVDDPAGDRLLLFAGRNAGRMWSDTWALPLAGGPWSSFAAAPPAPASRLAEAAVYDPVRRQVVMFGGITGGGWSTGVLGDTWALLTSPAPAWVPADAATVARPAARGSHLLVRDAAQDRIVLFGGNSAFAFYNDTWQYDPAAGTWSEIPAEGSVPGLPSPRESMAGAFDPVRHRLVVFGGTGATGVVGETWTLDPDQPLWTLQSPMGTPPAARFGSTMVYDPRADRFLLFGGQDAAGALRNDVWALSFVRHVTWTELAPAGAPPTARLGHAAIYDPVRHRMVVVGGYDGDFRSDVYALDLTVSPPAWSSLSPGGFAPSPRDWAAAVYDSDLDRLLLIDGNGRANGPRDAVASLAETWSLAWADLPTPALLSFADEQVGPGTVELTWFTADGAGRQAMAQRSPDGVAWQDLTPLTSDASARFVLDDAVPGGGRFAYRLEYAVAGTGPQPTDAHWVTIPAASFAFGITGTGANPSHGALAVSFVLGAAGEAGALDLFDVRGRRVLHHDLAGLGAGAHTLDLVRGRSLATGVYWLRLAQGARRAQRKVAVVR